MPADLSFTGKHWATPRHASARAGALPHTLRKERALGNGAAAPDIPSLQDAAALILETVAAGRLVTVVGDYDCDGITAAAQLARFFGRANAPCALRLPHRVHDGYGLSRRMVEECRMQGTALLITVDNGISAVDEIAFANDCGMQTIVVDHHAVGDTLPPAHVLVHPALCGLPEPHPCGAGLAYLLLATLEKNDWEERDTDMALAMIGTVADLVELRGFNRTLVAEGLEALQRIESGPLAALRDRTAARTSTDVAFRLAPRINAAGRMANPSLALHALLHGGQAFDELESLNTERQALVLSLSKGLLERAAGVQEPLFFAADAAYPHGILGLLAGKITEASGKPSCIVAIDGDQCTASLRSPPCYHITDGLRQCSDLLTRFGGHAQAAGCTFPAHALAAVCERLTADIAGKVPPESLMPMLTPDGLLRPEDISLALCKEIATLEPFGRGNVEPLFLLPDIRPDHCRTVGTSGAHLQCTIQGHKAIGFGLGPFLHGMHCPVDALCRLQMNHWNGHTQPQIVLEDIRLCKTTPEALATKENVVG